MIPTPTSSPLGILHAHTTMSVLDGASSVKEYVEYAQLNGLGHCGTTEHGYLLGDFYLDQACGKAGVKPLHGCEFYLRPRENHVFANPDKPYRYYHLTVWAMNQAGYRNLLALSSLSWGANRVVTIWGHHRPCITWDDLAIYNAGLVIGSGCIEGPIGKSLLAGEDQEACINALTLWDIFKGRMFFEIMPGEVANNYRKEDVVVVNDLYGGRFTLHPDDIITTDGGEIKASDAVSLRPSLVTRFAPPRRQVHSTFEPTATVDIMLDAGSWGVESKTFLGNECSYPPPSGQGPKHACMQKYVNAQVVRIARMVGGPLLLTLDSHFVDPERKMIQDILLQNGNKDGWRFFNCYNQMKTEEAWEKWQKNHHDIPDSTSAFVEGVENNRTLVDMVEQVKLEKKMHLPVVDYRERSVQVTGETEEERLEKLVLGYIEEYGRMPKEDEGEKVVKLYRDRLKRELDVIARNPTLNFLSYFITLHDICRYSMEQGVLPGPGRGSAAGCLLSYLLRITHVDPIIWNLPFDRFLSLGRIARGKFPDIDLDFGNPKIVVEWLAQKHGEKFARICTTNTMKPKGAIRDVSRVLLDTGNNPGIQQYVNEVCESLPKTFPPNTDAKKWLYGYEYDGVAKPGLIDENPLLRKFFEQFPQVKTCVDLLLDVPRALGRHASAYCLADEPIGSLIPMCRIGDEPCTQLTMGPVEKMGLIKFDLLGINTLNDITACLKLIKERHGRDIWPWDGKDIPFDDEITLKRFCQGHTETIFQFNSAISTNLCIQVKPKSILDLSNITANGRPGIMYAMMEDGKTTLIQAWIERRQGTREVEYLHPDLEEILKPTDGIFTYQESLMAATVKCCGYSMEQADYVREIVGKKKPEDLEKILPELREELRKRNWTESQVESFISTYRAASGYSFNLAHSACYALIGYVCQYLKTHYPLEWWNAVLSNSTIDDLKKSAQHCRHLVVPPDINTSSVEFYIIDDDLGKLVFPIGFVKNVKNAGPHIVGLRRQTGDDGVERETPFSSLEDFYERIDRRLCNSRVVSSLIWAGAFDKLLGIKSVTERNGIYRSYLELKKDKKKLAEFEDLAEERILLNQTELLAIGHADFVELVCRKTGKKVFGPDSIKKYSNGVGITVVGMVQRAVHTKTKKQPSRPMGFIDLVNESETCSVTVFPDDYATFRQYMKENAILIVDGIINEYQGKTGLIAQNITPFNSEEEQDSTDDVELI